MNQSVDQLTKRLEEAERRAELAEKEAVEAKKAASRAKLEETRAKRRAAIAKKEARTDVLTGLGNKLKFEEDRKEDRRRRQKNRIVYIAADLDLLKGVNDCFGHECGDTYIQLVGNKIKEIFANVESLLRKEDKVSLVKKAGAYRPSGDEFIIRLVGVAGENEIEILQNARVIARRIQEQIESLRLECTGKYKDKEGTFKVSPRITFGVGTTPKEADAELIANKDRRRIVRGEIVCEPVAC